MIKPTKINRNGSEGIIIEWLGGAKNELPSKLLRTNCPCAQCKENRGDTTHSKPLTGKKSLLRVVESSNAEHELKLEKIWQVGQYALGMEWADGHSTGIYTFEYLKELGDKV